MFVIGLSFSASRLRFWRQSARPVGHNGWQISEVGGVPKTGHLNAIGDSTLDAASELSRPSSKERQAHAGVIGEALETVGVYVLERWRPPKSHCKLRGQVWPHMRCHQVVKRCENSFAIITRSEEHTSELQSLMRSSYAVF